MEASTLQAPATLPQPRISVGTPLLRFRSDQQLVALFRAGHEEAFRAIHDRYHKRLFAYARQMLPGRQDAEDALQDVFVRAYSGLRANDRDLALRAWLFRVAHNRCIDELRRPAPPPPEVLHLVRSSVQDPLVEVDLRESLRRLITDVRRLPDQQRSALLLRELGGLSYAELASSLGISVGAVKSVLVRARIALAQAAEARDTACGEIREELVGAYDRGVRPNANARRHMRDCAGCRGFRRELRGVNRQLAGLAPTVGPLGFLTKVLGISGGASGGATASGATAGGAAVVGGGVAASTGGVVLGAGHVATLIAAAVATAGGAVEIQHTIAPPHRPAARVHRVARPTAPYVPLATPISESSYAEPPSYSVSAVVVESVNAAAQNARAAVLARHPTVKRQLRDSSSTGTGGGGMIGQAPASTQSTTGSGGSGTGLPTATTLTGDGATTGTGTGTSSPSTTGGSGGSADGAGATGSTTTDSGTSGSGSGSTVNTTNTGSSSSGSGSTSGTSGTGGSTTSTSSTSSGSSTGGSTSGTTSATPL